MYSRTLCTIVQSLGSLMFQTTMVITHRALPHTTHAAEQPNAPTPHHSQRSWEALCVHLCMYSMLGRHWMIAAVLSQTQTNLPHHQASQMPVQLPSSSSKDRVGSTCMDSDDSPLSLPFFYQHKDDVGRAEAAYRAAVQADPSDAVAYGNLGILLQSEKKDFDGAVEAFRAATVVDPSNPQWHLNLGSSQSVVVSASLRRPQPPRELTHRS
jgi:tetratricopeptide (TPR) repeat protein